MVLDLLLVNVGSSKKVIYQDLSRDYSAIEPPFWAALTAAFIRNKGYEVNILDANAENLTHAENTKEIEKSEDALPVCINALKRDKSGLIVELADLYKD